MKKITLLLLLTIPVFSGYAQSAKLVNAINYLKDYQKNNDQESLKKAKENIDIVTQNADTKDPAKALKVKGQIYVALFENNLKIQTEKLASITDPNKKTLTAYENTPATDLDIAAQSFAAAKTNDPKNIYVLDIMTGSNQILNHYFNKANGHYNAQQYDESLQFFEKAYELDESKDTNLLNNIALTASYSHNYEKAKSTYSKMAEAKLGGPSTYGSLVNAYLMLKDTVGGMEALKKGRAVYPSDIPLLSLETDHFLKINKTDDALKNLNKVIEAKPNEANLYLVRGNVYERLANPLDAKGMDMAKPANYAEYIKNSEADYKKSVELGDISYKNAASAPAKEKADVETFYSTALFTLGAFYFNRGASIAKVADKITDNAKFAAENAKANVEFNKAMIPLEKALAVKPSKDVLYALKQIYTRLELADKLKGINEQLKN